MACRCTKIVIKTVDRYGKDCCSKEIDVEEIVRRHNWMGNYLESDCTDSLCRALCEELKAEMPKIMEELLDKSRR